MTARRVELQRPPELAWEALVRAARQVGTLEEQAPAARSIVMKARYGANPVRLRAAVLSGPQGGTSVLEIQARGQDIFGGASRKVIDRLVAALD